MVSFNHASHGMLARHNVCYCLRDVAKSRESPLISAAASAADLSTDNRPSIEEHWWCNERVNHPRRNQHRRSVLITTSKSRRVRMWSVRGWMNHDHERKDVPYLKWNSRGMIDVDQAGGNLVEWISLHLTITDVRKLERDFLQTHLKVEVVEKRQGSSNIGKGWYFN